MQAVALIISAPGDADVGSVMDMAGCLARLVKEEAYEESSSENILQHLCCATFHADLVDYCTIGSNCTLHVVIENMLEMNVGERDVGSRVKMVKGYTDSRQGMSMLGHEVNSIACHCR